MNLLQISPVAANYPLTDITLAKPSDGQRQEPYPHTGYHTYIKPSDKCRRHTSNFKHIPTHYSLGQ